MYQKYSDLLDVLNDNAKPTTASMKLWGQLDNPESSFHRYIMPLAVGAVPAVKLDENSDGIVDAISDNGGDHKVLITLERTLHSGKWNTICLPFSMTSADLKAYFGDGVKLETFSSATIDENGALTLNFASATELAAKTPYLINPSSVSTDNNTYLIDSRPIESVLGSNKDVTVNGGKVIMHGNYDKITLDGNADGYDQYFLQNDKFYHIVPSNPLTAKGFRCYFAVSKNITLNKAMVKHDDGSTTAISIVEVGTAADGSQKIYDLRGIEQGTTPKGIYIRNGKKFSMK